MFTVQDFMTDSVYTIKPNDTVHDVKELMKLAKIRHTPVVDSDGRFCGLVTNRDLLSYTVSKLADISEAVKQEIDKLF